MLKASNQINKQGCNCGRYGPSLEHSLTCPRKSIFLLGYPVCDTLLTKEDVFISFGYGKSITLPKHEDVIKHGDQMAEMMQCDCGHWFPRWEYYRCPKCQADH